VDLARLDATALAELIRQGDLAPVDVLEDTLDRIDRIDQELNSVVTRMDEIARSTVAASRNSDAPFSGVPMLVKENAAVAGVRLTAGSRLFRDRVAPKDSELVRRYRAAGFVIAGKTNMPEFGMLGTTESTLFGPARNPWALARTPGGSSGGSAAAVAAGIVPVAHGGDSGGSIRIPASCCGVFGLKPSRGRNPMQAGSDPGGLTAEHVITRSVRDSASILDATAGHYGGAPWCPPPPASFRSATERDPRPLRIGVSSSSPLGFEVHSECVRAVEDAAALATDLGHHVEEAEPSFGAPEELFGAFDVIWTSELANWISAIAEQSHTSLIPELVEPLTLAILEIGRSRTTRAYQQALQAIEVAAAVAETFHETYDVWLTPTAASPPVPLGWIDQPPDDPMRAYRRDAEFCAFTPIANMTGQPAASLPLWWDASDVPVGVQLTGRFGDEWTLFALSAQYERARNWADRRPTISAAEPDRPAPAA
jgi:amidase